MPLHPRTRNVLDEDLKTSFASAGGVLINPVGYLDMLMLERQARLIVTDSGGVQKRLFSTAFRASLCAMKPSGRTGGPSDGTLCCRPAARICCARAQWL